MRRRRWIRWGLGACLTLVLLYGLLAGVVFVAMLQPPDRFGQFMAHIPEPAFVVFAVVPFEGLWNVARGGDLAVGDEAPDFDLLPAPREAVQERVRLSALRGRPVVLVFGSYT